MSQPGELYDAAYANFSSDVYAEIRREAYGQDIGQNSWLTADEYAGLLPWLRLTTASRVLEVACGSGGPARFLAKTSGSTVVGIDNNAQSIDAARRITKEHGEDPTVTFKLADATQPLPFEDASFDAIVCIDAIHHLPVRANVLADWHRLLKSKGRALFTDPALVTGQISSQELASRSLIGPCTFTALGENERLLEQTSFSLIHSADVTDNQARISKARLAARAKRTTELVEIEGTATFHRTQEFLGIVHRLSSERRLSRFVFVAERPA